MPSRPCSGEWCDTGEERCSPGGDEGLVEEVPAPWRSNVAAVSSVAFFSLRLQGQVLTNSTSFLQCKSASTLGFCSLVDFSVSQSISGKSPS